MAPLPTLVDEYDAPTGTPKKGNFFADLNGAFGKVKAVITGLNTLYRTVLALSQTVDGKVPLTANGTLDPALLPAYSPLAAATTMLQAIAGWSAGNDQVLTHAANGAITWQNGALGSGGSTAAVMSVSIAGFTKDDSAYASPTLSPYTVANSVQDCHLLAYVKNAPAGATLSFDWTYPSRPGGNGFIDQYGPEANGVGIDRITPAGIPIGTTILHLVVTATVAGQAPVTATAPDFSIIRNA